MTPYYKGEHLNLESNQFAPKAHCATIRLRPRLEAPERWLSGRKQRFAKPISRLKQVQENKP
jgi:hypothetical protein